MNTWRVSRHLLFVGVLLLLVTANQVAFGQSTDAEMAMERGKESARAALEAADTNGDGKISQDEARGPARLFTRNDRDGDGFLTLADFEAAMTPPETAVANSLGPNLDDRALLERLEAGGLVIVFRHGKTHREQTDGFEPRALPSMSPAERQSVLLDCSTQRILTDEGREELVRVGTTIRTIGFLVGDLHASPMCRTRETAWLAFGRVTPNDALVMGQAIQERRRMAGTVPARGANNVIITHSQIVRSIVWYPANPANAAAIGLPEGNAFVVEPLGDSRYRFLANLGPEDWYRLARQAEATR